MESAISSILFYVFAAAAVLCAFGVVAFRNPVSSAMNMALSFGFTAAVYFGMGAQFLGIVQLIVYAGAILVLFLFIIMMLDIKAEEHARKSFPLACIAVIIAGIFAGFVTKVAISLPGATVGECPAIVLCESIGELAPGSIAQKAETEGFAPYGSAMPELSPAAAAKALGADEATAAAATAFPDTKLLGQSLFTKYNIPFVILSFALLAGTVGAVALGRKLRKD
ncbi:MAG: NADH-quinone oxidoreductase subunit J [Akkermansia sp.]|nr:NADH-quinone oxidoreductase subunit J [Akkermansia sp.]